ncbi:MAG TPA: glucoamylase family protein, partial [Chitinophagaceae bacterium]|nr:glucoamylase family protein [Chitinophagaceae bacterium]
AFTTTFDNHDSAVLVKPSGMLQPVTQYTVQVSTALQSQQKGSLQSAVTVTLVTGIDSTDKFPRVSDSVLLTMVQQQTFKYFWDFGHPVSGMARERNSSGDIVTTGGTGFGIMAMAVAVNRNFITRAAAVTRLTTIVDFLTNTATSYHGAFAHWINGATGATVPFSTNDNGADLVETSYLMAGLLTARQYFNTADAAETALRTKINNLWNKVEWDWFRQNNQTVLYWHWSPDKAWIMNVPIRGWNEALITYILAASSTTHTIDSGVYKSGWALNGSIRNGASSYGYALPLGPSLGGPLFFEHYSFLGINPNGLTDQYAAYQTQVTNHTLINYSYCKTNPNNYYGYSDSCWGLTASDVPNGYAASSPTSDIGVIAPTAALSSFPYTPTQSMKALKFFYYKLGNKLWGQYGFYDAFSLKDTWFAGSTLAIDQGPIVVMIENYRSGLAWNLLMSCPEIKAGLLKLGFQSPNI